MSYRSVVLFLLSIVFMVCGGGCGKDETTHFTEIPALDEIQLRRILSQNKFAMIEFGGRHCKPCRKMQPILSELAKEYGDRISLANVFVQQRMNLGRDYNIRLIPTQIIFDRNGKEICRHTGFWKKSHIL